MNEDPETASLWKGRILIGIEHYDMDHPKYAVEDIHDIILMKKAEEM